MLQSGKLRKIGNGEFEPIIVKKHERMISSELEDMIVSLFAQGMSNPWRSEAEIGRAITIFRWLLHITI